MPKPAGSVPADHFWPPSVVLAATPAVASFGPNASSQPTAVQSMLDEQVSDPIESPERIGLSLNVLPPSLVERNVALVVPMAKNSLDAAKPAQNPEAGTRQGVEVADSGGQRGDCKRVTTVVGRDKHSLSVVSATGGAIQYSTACEWARRGEALGHRKLRPGRAHVGTHVEGLRQEGRPCLRRRVLAAHRVTGRGTRTAEIARRGSSGGVLLPRPAQRVVHQFPSPSQHVGGSSTRCPETGRPACARCRCRAVRCGLPPTRTSVPATMAITQITGEHPHRSQVTRVVVKFERISAIVKGSMYPMWCRDDVRPQILEDRAGRDTLHLCASTGSSRANAALFAVRFMVRVPPQECHCSPHRCPVHVRRPRHVSGGASSAITDFNRTRARWRRIRAAVGEQPSTRPMSAAFKPSQPASIKSSLSSDDREAREDCIIRLSSSGGSARSGTPRSSSASRYGLVSSAGPAALIRHNISGGHVEPEESSMADGDVVQPPPGDLVSLGDDVSRILSRRGTPNHIRDDAGARRIVERTEPVLSRVGHRTPHQASSQYLS